MIRRIFASVIWGAYFTGSLISGGRGAFIGILQYMVSLNVKHCRKRDISLSPLLLIFQCFAELVEPTAALWQKSQR